MIEGELRKVTPKIDSDHGLPERPRFLEEGSSTSYWRIRQSV